MDIMEYNGKRIHQIPSAYTKAWYHCLSLSLTVSPTLVSSTLITSYFNALHNSQVAKLLLVSGHLPLTILNHVVHLLVQVGSGLGNVVHGQLVKWSGRLNVLQGFLELLDFLQHRFFGQFGVLNRLLFKEINGLQRLADIVGGRLERRHSLLDLVNNLLVLQHQTVVVKINGMGFLLQSQVLLLSLIVSLFESSQGRGGRSSQSQR